MRPGQNARPASLWRGRCSTALRSAATLVIAVALIAACGGQSTTSRLNIVYSSPKGGGQVGRLADVTILRTGILLAVWSGGPGATSENRGTGACVAAISLDQGRSWGNPFTIYSVAGLDVRGTGVSQLDDGRVAVTVDLAQPNGQHVQYAGATRVLYLPAVEAADRTGHAVESSANWEPPVVLAKSITNRSSFLDGYDNSINPISDLGNGTLVEPFQISEPFRIIAVRTGKTTVIEANQNTNYRVGNTVTIAGVQGAKGINGRQSVLSVNGNYLTLSVDTTGQPAGHGGTMVANEVTSGVCGILVSHDDGKLWEWTQITLSPDQFMAEPAFTEVGSTWLFAARDQTTKQLWVYRSTDTGRTWSLTTKLSQVYGGPRLTTLPDGTVMLFARLSANDGIGALMWSTTQGLQWSDPLQVNSNESSIWFDYGGVVQTGPGRLVVVFSEFSRLNGSGCGKVVTGEVNESGVKTISDGLLRRTFAIDSAQDNTQILAC